MQIVIDISDDDYRKVQDGRGSVSMMRKVIRNGIPLPKGHGRLIDAEVFAHNVVKYSHQSTKTIGQALSDTPTIIEADKAESDGEE